MLGIITATISTFAVIIFMGSCTVIDGSEAGVSRSFGEYAAEPLSDGVYFQFPVVRIISTMDLRTQKVEIKASASSKDLQTIRINNVVTYALDRGAVVNLLKTVGDEEMVFDRVIGPRVIEALKAAAAKFTAEQQVTQRAELKRLAFEMALKSLKGSGVILKDISIKNIGFEQEFLKAIEDKQIAEQEALKAGYAEQKAKAEGQAAVAKARAEAEAQLIAAEAQAKANRVISESLTKKILKDKFLSKWDGKLPKVMSDKNDLLLNVDAK